MKNNPTVAAPRGAFALVELVAVVSICALLAAALAVALRETRRSAGLTDDLSNLKQYAGGTSAFAADNEDGFWTFSWLPNSSYTVIENGVTITINTPPDLVGAHAQQAGHLLRARGMVTFPTPSTWLPHVLFSHWVLLDYLDSEFPARFTISSADRNRLQWQRTIRDDRSGRDFARLPNRPAESLPLAVRWPFSSSFELGPAFFAQDARAGSVSTLAQAQSHRIYTTGAAPLGGRRMSEVRFPSQKAMVWDQYQRHFGHRTAYFAYAEARIPVLCADGAASVRTTGPSTVPAGTPFDTNPGFQPNNPALQSATRYSYTPEMSWEPPTMSGHFSELVSGFYRWTRSGLRGRDFGGREVPWMP